MKTQRVKAKDLKVGDYLLGKKKIGDTKFYGTVKIIDEDVWGHPRIFFTNEREGGVIEDFGKERHMLESYVIIKKRQTN